jgi:3-hydroxy-3-methylglutaryl CoA synthase
MFSYGSGLASSMFVLKIKDDLNHIRTKVDLNNRLE